MSQVRGGICLHLSLSAPHTGITHSLPDMWLATPAPHCGWQCVCVMRIQPYKKKNSYTHPSLCSHPDSHISWFLNPRWSVFFKKHLEAKIAQKQNPLFFVRFLFGSLFGESHHDKLWEKKKKKETTMFVSLSEMHESLCVFVPSVDFLIWTNDKRGTDFIPPVLTASAWAGLSHYWQDSLSIQGNKFQSGNGDRANQHEIILLSIFRHKELNQ